MNRLEVSLAATIQGYSDWVELSPDGKSIAVRSGIHWRIADTLTGSTEWTFDFEGRWTVLANGGRRIAGRVESNGVAVVGVRGPQKMRDFESRIVDLIFTPDGTQLWVLSDRNDGRGTIALLDSDSMKVLDTLEPHLDLEDEVPWGPEWGETTMAVHSPSGTVAVAQSAGDSYLGTHFFRVDDGQAVQLTNSIAWDNGADYLRPLRDLCFSESGAFFAALDGLILNVWQLPELTLIDGSDALNLDEQFIGLGFLGDFVLVAVERNTGDTELRLLGIANDKCVVVSHAKLALRAGKFQWVARPVAAEGRTFVAVQGDEVLIYNVTLGS